MVFKSRAERSHYISAYNKSLALWKIPYSEEDVKTSFGTAHVILSGPKDAPALVLLHGMNASSTMWFPNIEALSKNRRVYAIDFLTEPGKSVSMGKTLSKEEIVLWYNEIFKHYKLNNFEIIGASAGAWYGVLLAIQDDSKIKKLVLLGPAQTFENIDERGKSTPAILMKFFPSKKKWDKTLENFSTDPKKIPMVFKRQSYLAYKTKIGSNFWKMQPFSNDELKKINIPVLVLTGDKDIINSESGHKKAKETLSNYKGEVIPNAGHFLTIDQKEIVNKKIIAFLGK
ncbi:alpha/beta fold hydrolase [Flavobacterium terrigena]|uniref:Pimeloyl-ACP methyl ester carboxylesterase n=1 Tax=Flavobacterium terrigena TaxID=402734 RepID=A0A1H6Q2B9_9FLAO|nr:Pimeloyl-ACP methyl ester carboxylesterase [Flavobacterium terrigena]